MEDLREKIFSSIAAKQIQDGTVKLVRLSMSVPASIGVSRPQLRSAAVSNVFCPVFSLIDCISLIPILLHRSSSLPRSTAFRTGTKRDTALSEMVEAAPS